VVAVRRVVRDAGWAERLCRRLAPGQEGLDSWMKRHTRVLKQDRHSCVGLLELSTDLCYLKWYRSKSVFQSLVFELGRGRGVDSFDAAAHLAAAGIAVPAPRCVLLARGGMLLLTEGLADSADLKSLWQRSGATRDFKCWMAPAGEALAKLHVSGFSHGDCKWSNFQCCDRGVVFVDLEAVRSSPLGTARQSRDLARFTLNAEDMGLPREDYERFLEAYLVQSSQDRDAVLDRLRAPLGALRQKHLGKYGPRGHRLL